MTQPMSATRAATSSAGGSGLDLVDAEDPAERCDEDVTDVVDERDDRVALARGDKQEDDARDDQELDQAEQEHHEALDGCERAGRDS